MENPSPKYCETSNLYFPVKDITILYQIAMENNIPINEDKMYCPKCGEELIDVNSRPRNADVYNNSRRKIEITELMKLFQGQQTTPR